MSLLLLLTKVKPSKRRKKTNLSLLREISTRGPRPVVNVDFCKAQHRIASVDWFSDDVFGRPVDDVLKQQTYDLGIGFHSLTLTLDTKRSAFIDDAGKVRFDAMLREIPRRFQEANLNYIMVVDLHENGYPHIHLFIVLQNEQQVRSTEHTLGWWKRRHGDYHRETLHTKLDCQKWVSYILKWRSWHSNPPQHTGLDSVSVCREMALVRSKGIPRITDINVLPVQNPSTSPKYEIPEVVFANGVTIKLPYARYPEIGDFTQIKNEKVLKNILALNHRGGCMAVYNAWMQAVVHAIEPIYRQPMIDRITEPAVVEIYLSVAAKGGLRRAMSFLYNTASGSDPNFVWKLVSSYNKQGYSAQVRIATEKSVRYETDLGVTDILGIKTLSPEIIEARINAG